MQSLTENQKQQALDAILARAAGDRGFRQALLAEPRAAIWSEFGIRIPAEFRVKFVEKDPDVDALVVLPDFVSAEAELSDEDLEAVSGGTETETLAAWSGDPTTGP